MISVAATHTIFVDSVVSAVFFNQGRQADRMSLTK